MVAPRLAPLLILLAACSVAREERHTSEVQPTPTGSAAPAPSASAAPSAKPAEPVAKPAPAPIDTSDDALPVTLKEQRELLYKKMAAELELPDDKIAAIRAIVDPSPIVGQGNPRVAKHPMKRSECRAIRAAAGLVSEAHPPCTAKNTVPVFDPAAGETAKDAKLCIDQFEFPNLACEYPVVHVQPREAALLCKAVGKRLCDAHEWEGACAGALHKPEVEYAWDKARLQSTYLHNKDRQIVWAYGKEKNHALCATNSAKTVGCVGGGWKECGSNTYPTGAFPRCVSPFGVYDQHGNAAEHMNLPLSAEELSSRGGTGQTEMKGSWFVFQLQEAHADDCRWRAPDWHASKIMDPAGHPNYHLGFRCCQDVEAAGDAG